MREIGKIRARLDEAALACEARRIDRGDLSLYEQVRWRKDNALPFHRISREAADTELYIVACLEPQPLTEALVEETANHLQAMGFEQVHDFEKAKTRLLEAVESRLEELEGHST